MKYGLDIFDYEHSQYPDLQLVERENELLMKIWKYKADFDNCWNKWKHIQFYKLIPDEMEDVVISFLEKI